MLDSKAFTKVQSVVLIAIVLLAAVVGVGLILGGRLLSRRPRLFA